MLSPTASWLARPVASEAGVLDGQTKQRGQSLSAPAFGSRDHEVATEEGATEEADSKTADAGCFVKRTTGLEPATYGLGSRRSTN